MHAGFASFPADQHVENGNERLGVVEAVRRRAAEEVVVVKVQGMRRGGGVLRQDRVRLYARRVQPPTPSGDAGDEFVDPCCEFEEQLAVKEGVSGRVERIEIRRGGLGIEDSLRTVPFPRLVCLPPP